ncbi:MAG: FAD:protein FMN transferase [Gammaproteobacteria bacterium]|nr:FAD:protein FMN transferase [Gammaproteobacteria bacterium]
MRAYSHLRFVIIGFGITLLSLLAACERVPEVYQQQVLALGTLVDISIYGIDDKKAHAAVDAITGQLEAIQHHWHAWQPSRLTEINAKLQAGEAVTLSPDESRIFQQAIDVSKRSDYLFDPAIGKMVTLWGFHSDERPITPPPSRTEIQVLLQQHPSMADLTLENNILRSRNPAVQIDFGGFAKGVAIDLAIAELKRLGIDNAIVNAGGDLRVIGHKGKQPWRIGIRHPRVSGVIASIETQGDESVYTSGDYERYFDYQGHRYHHIIDPRSGMPVQGVTSVTVIHTDAAIAEAADKALFIVGTNGFAKMASQLNISQAMLVDNEGTVYLTPAMEKRIHFEIEPKPKTIIVQP